MLVFSAAISFLLIFWAAKALISRGVFSLKLLCLVGALVGFLLQFGFAVHYTSSAITIISGQTKVVLNGTITFDGYMFLARQSLVYAAVGVISSIVIWAILRRKVNASSE